MAERVFKDIVGFSNELKSPESFNDADTRVEVAEKRALRAERVAQLAISLFFQEKIRTQEAEIRTKEAEERSREAEERAEKAENHALEAEELSTIDALTGCNNVRFLDRLISENFNPKRTKMVVAVLDIDNLKAVNDKYGHSTGNELIKFTADMLKKSVFRKSDILVRIGGDEFLFIYNTHDCDQTAFVEIVEERLQEFRSEYERNVNAYARENGSNYKAGFSYGVAYFDRKLDEDDLNKTIVRADYLMYEYKQANKLVEPFED